MVGIGIAVLGSVQIDGHNAEDCLRHLGCVGNTYDTEKKKECRDRFKITVD